jgi:alkylation response protein AidB-like acyl-CoA dehydrogenase
VDFELSDAQAAVAAAARAFARDEVAPRSRAADEEGVFPLDLVARMGELGFLAGPVEPELGGSGMDYVSFAQVYRALGYADASVRGFLAVHGGLVTLCLRDHGSEEQRRTWIPRLATGEVIGCYALTEPGAGSDAGAIATSARREGSGYVLDGTKIWITNGNIAHLALVFARDPSLPAERPQRQISAFLVPADRPGFHRGPMPGVPLGHRAADHARITLDGCRVPASALVGPPGGGFRIAMAALDHGRLGVAAGALGLAEACLDAAVEFARHRRAFGRRLGDFGMLQAVLADMSTEVDAARHLVNHAAWLKDRGRPSTRATASAKLFATEAALRSADQAVLLHGGRGYANEYPVERYLRDAKGMQIYEGTSHIQRIVIARELVGRPDAVEP